MYEKSQMKDKPDIDYNSRKMVDNTSGKEVYDRLYDTALQMNSKKKMNEPEKKKDQKVLSKEELNNFMQRNIDDAQANFNKRIEHQKKREEDQIEKMQTMHKQPRQPKDDDEESKMPSFEVLYSNAVAMKQKKESMQAKQEQQRLKKEQEEAPFKPKINKNS